MTAIMKRELSAYFKSPIGYVFIAVSFLFAVFEARRVKKIEAYKILIAE